MLQVLECLIYLVYNLQILDPDLVERIRYNFPLTEANPDTFFEGEHIGYIDYLPF